MASFFTELKGDRGSEVYLMAQVELLKSEIYILSLAASVAARIRRQSGAVLQRHA